MTLRRLLIVSPKFHSYWKSIEGAFRQLGYDVFTHRYDDALPAEKAFNKVRFELVGRLRGDRMHVQSPEVVSQRAIQALRQHRPDVVLVIRGDDLTSGFWQAVDESGARRALWLYDEVRRMKYRASDLLRLSPIATYSRHDEEWLRGLGVATIHVANAYDPARPLPPRRPRPEISFVGARLPKRETLLLGLADAGVPVRAYGRDWSSHPLDRLRTWRWTTPHIPNARDLPLEEAWGVMRDSLATVNIHGDQDGFTMRTFEAPGVGAVQLIDRPDVEEYFEPDREVLVFTDLDSLVDQSRRAVSDPRAMTSIRERGAKRALAEHTFVHRARSLEALWA